MEKKGVTIPRDQFMQLLELAAEALNTRDCEFSSYPTNEERKLMLSLYRLVGEEVPSCLTFAFKRTVIPETQGVESDGRNDTATV